MLFYQVLSDIGNYLTCQLQQPQLVVSPCAR